MKLLRCAKLILLIGLIISAISLAQDDEDNVIRIAASWQGAEAQGFQTVIDAFTEQTGIDVIYEPDPLLVENVVKSGFLEDPTDIALLPRPGVIRELAEGLELVPLDNEDDPLIDPDLIDETLSREFLRLGTFDNELYGLMVTSRSKSTIWYNVDSFEEYDFEIPQTWDELVAITDTYVANGDVPFALGGGDGWTLTDWFENIYIRLYGQLDYNRLFVVRSLRWDDPKVATTLDLMAQVLLPYDDHLPDGTDSILEVGHREAVRSWLEGETSMYYEGGFVRGYAQEIFPDLICDEDYSFFTFPEINPDYGTPIVGGGQLAVVFNDTDAVREFMNFIASEEGATVWVTAEVGSIISPNLEVDIDNYRDDCFALEAEQIRDARTFVFDGSDLMTGIFGEYAFFTALQDYLLNPNAMSEILEYLVIAESKS